MLKKILTITITILILTSAFLIFNQNTSSASTGTPSQLSIYTGPTSVLADTNSYNCIFVQLKDSSGQPARALQATTISLSSSLTNIGTVDPSITIPKGATYASANFNTTFSPGTSTISASATGYATVQASMTTIGPIPSALAVYGFPSTLPADGGSYASIMVQLQDSSGFPAKAPEGGVQVSLLCSNTNVGTISPSVTILGGQTYAIATFTTNATTHGQAIVYAVAQNYASNQVTITTQSISTALPYQLRIFVGPTQFPADANAYQQIAVELQDSSGNIAAAPSDLPVTIASSDETVGTTDSQITIPQNQTYALSTLTTTYKPGSTTITAAATNLTASHSAISTIGFIPSKLAVFCVPSTLPADNATYQAIIVQLQDSQGRPAIDPEAGVSVNLFASQPTVGVVSSTLTIPFGETQATGNLTVTNAPGANSITAQASGYTTSQASITTYLIDYSPLQITVTGNPTTIDNGYTSAISAYVTANGAPVTGATITFTSNNGGTFTATTEQGNGYYNASFTASSFTQITTCTITASGSKTGYLNGQGTTQITVNPAPAPTPTPTPTPAPTPTPTPTPIPTGTITLLIEDSTGNPLESALVSSTTQPTGVSTLIEVTNATGYATFQNAPAGSYTFKISKLGYPEMNETISYNAQPLTRTVNLSDSTVKSSSNSSSTIIVIVSVVVAAVAVAVITSLFMLRGKKSPNTKKLQELQKQMKPKFQT